MNMELTKDFCFTYTIERDALCIIAQDMYQNWGVRIPLDDLVGKEQPDLVHTILAGVNQVLDEINGKER